ncbi:MAG TPA: substrate-binding domain-containing protein [Burkholderiales bacterium]
MKPFLFAMLLAAATGLQAAEIKVLSSNALKAVLEELAPQFEKNSGHTIKAQFAPAADLKARIERREDFDITILTAALMDDLAKMNHIVLKTRFDLAKVGAGVAIRKGAPKPDLSSGEGFKRSLLAAKSIAYVGTGATGATMRKAFDRLGIAEEMKAKTRLLSGVSAAEAVAKGEAELGFSVVSEILGVAGAELAGPLPPELQVYLVFPVAGSASAPDPRAGLQFLQFLKTPEAAKVIRAKGMEPG